MAAPHHRPKRNRILRTLFFLIVAWPGPRPVVHAHSEFSGHPLMHRCLAEHIARYHSQADSNVLDPCLFHCHWIIGMSDGSGDVLVVSPQYPDPLPVDGDQVSQLRDRIDEALICSLESSTATHAPREVTVRLNTPSRDSCGVPIHAFFCVWTC